VCRSSSGYDRKRHYDNSTDSQYYGDARSAKEGRMASSMLGGECDVTFSASSATLLLAPPPASGVTSWRSQPAGLSVPAWSTVTPAWPANSVPEPATHSHTVEQTVCPASVPPSTSSAS